MRSLLRSVGTALLFLVAAVCFAPTAVPPFLDRIYYRGPASGHFDGERFFNPGGDVVASSVRRGFFRRWSTGERAPWPTDVPVAPARPERRVGADDDEMRVTWVGHATVLVQLGGLNILTDPIWSDRASPFAFMGPRRVRAPGIRFADLPPIDLVLVSHNHYDHLDVPTLRRLWERDRPLIVTGLGNDTILRGSGIGSEARDWGQSVELAPGCRAPGECHRGARVIVERNQHWSSRWFVDRNRALWSAFTVATPAGSFFFAGDTGWGDGGWVREVARRGPFRLAILPIGSYEPRDFMRSNHIDPAEALRIFEALDPARALGIHWGTFQLSFEPIDAPWQRLSALARERGHAPGRFVVVEAGRSFSVPRQSPAR